MLTLSARVSHQRWPYVLALTVGVYSIPLVHGQDTPLRLTFDVASIKLTKVKLDENKSLIRPLSAGEGYSARNAPVRLLISAMYNVPMGQITGGPDWLDTDGYDVEAKADHSYRSDDLRGMFQNLLADRFQLKFHKEMREGPVYVLTVDKSGSKLKVNESPADPTWSPLRSTRDYVDVWEKVSMTYFCRWLGPALQSQQLPVIDKTGLVGNYDFSLAYLPEFPPGFDMERIPATYRALPSIFDALHELGLNLQRQKGPSIT
jgi:uncharacterized protein (TIGR03435 family)